MANYVPRLKKVYKDEIAPALMKEFSYTTPMQIPAIKKIVVSMGVGEALTNKKLLDAAVADLTAITGQKAVKTKAKKSIANFKLREGNEVVQWLHCAVTLCMSSLIVSSMLLSHVLRISAESKQQVLMDTEISQLVLLNS